MKKGKLTALIASIIAITSLSGCNSNGYTIKWLNYDGTVLEVDKNVRKGEIPTYDGETPVRVEDDKYRYEFMNWFTAVAPVEKDASYVAQYYPISKTKGNAGDGIDYKDLAIKAGKALIEKFVPHGKEIVSVITSIIDFFKKDDKGKEPSLKDLKDDIANLRSELLAQYQQIENQLASLSAQQKQIAERLETIILSQTTISSKASDFDSLLTTLQATARQISAIQNDTSLSEQDKAVQLALLIGRNDKWVETSNLYNLYLNVLSTITGNTFENIKGNDLISLVYNLYLTTSLFTGEAKYNTQVYVSRVAYIALYAYTICAECLKAAEEVSLFTTEDLAKLNPTNKGYYDNSQVTSLYSVIANEYDFLNSKMFEVGFEEVSFADRMNEFVNEDMNKHIFTNCGTSNIELTDELVVKKYDGLGRFVEDQTEYNSWNFEDFVERIDNSSVLNASMRNAIVTHIQNSFKGTLREFLTALGYDLTNVAENAWFYLEMETTIKMDPNSHVTGIFCIITQGIRAINIDDPDKAIVDFVPIAKAQAYTAGERMDYIPVDAGCFVTIREKV